VTTAQPVFWPVLSVVYSPLSFQEKTVVTVYFSDLMLHVYIVRRPR